MAEPFQRNDYTLLKEAVNALSGVCDGADARDDQGFDGGDTRAGHLYAFLPQDAWPLSVFHRAWRWTQKYHRQLMAMGIDCSHLCEPPLFQGEDRQIALQPGNEGFFVTFPYDEALIAAFRQISGSDLHTRPISNKLSFRYRTVRPVAGAGASLLAFAEEYGFQLAPGVEDAARSLEASIEPQHESRVELDPNMRAYALYFPRQTALNEEVKRIPGRTFSGIVSFAKGWERE
jgi:hypothetical protein